MHFLAAGGKLGLGTAVHDVDLGSEPQGCAGCIHRHVAAAHYANLLASVDGSEVVFPPGLHEVVAGKELIGGEYAAEVLTGYVHELGKTGAAADEHGLEALGVHQGVNRNGLSYNDIGLYLDAELANFVNFVLEDLVLWETEFGDAVFQYAAGLVKGLENRHVVAPFGKVGSACESCRPAADNRDLDSVCGSARCGGFAERLVGDKPFELADGHRLALHAEHTAALALGLLRAYAAADCRQGTVACYHGGGSFDVALVHLCDEVGNLDVHGTSAYAAGVLAVQAPGCLKHSLLAVVSVAYFFEIGCADLGVLLAYSDSGYSVSHYFPLPILQTCFSFMAASSALYWPWRRMASSKSTS